VLDPLIELSFEDEDLSGILFTFLFEEIYLDSGNL
jgi:hypothetical protein